MTDTFTCGDYGALVSYLYDECAPGERLAISAHVAICSACAEELVALGATREQLASWAPPDAQLGFRIVSNPSPSNVLRPARWWQQPMPAWAQAAAAAVIFSTGVTLGALRGATPVISNGQAAAGQPRTTAASNASSVTRADLVALEQRLRSELGHGEGTTLTATPAADPHVLDRVRVMIDESEQRQDRALAFRTAEMMRDLDAQRNDDLARIERTIGQMDGTTGVEVAQQRQMLNYLMRVSQRGQ